MRGRPPKLHLSKDTRIWVDADGCSIAAGEALFALADRRRIVLTLICTKPRQWPNSAFIRSLLVSEGFDSVAQRMLQLATEGDVVVSRDTSLLRELAAKKIVTLDSKEAAGLADRLDAQLNAIVRPSSATAEKPKKSSAAKPG